MAIVDENADALRDGVKQAIQEASLNSVQFALAMNGEMVVHETLGAAPADARYLIWSSTKPLIASVIWQLIGEGLLDPGEPVTTWWPEFGRNGKDVVTLEQVMAHTAGFPDASLTEPAILDRDQRLVEMREWTLDWEPGTRYEYHGLSAHWVLAELIHRLTGADHVSALRARVLDPLGLDRLELGIPEDRQVDVQRIVHVGEPPSATEIEKFLGISLTELRPMVTAPADAPDIVGLLTRPEIMAAGVPGGGGVSDAASLALFYQHLLHDPKGLWDPVVLRDAKTNVRNMHADFLGRAAYRTLGFETAGDDEKAHMRIGAGVTSPGTFGHGGAGGQVAWADPETGLSFVALTDSFDANFVRAYRRDARFTRLAAACVEGNRR